MDELRLNDEMRMCADMIWMRWVGVTTSEFLNSFCCENPKIFNPIGTLHLNYLISKIIFNILLPVWYFWIQIKILSKEKYFGWLKSKI